MGVGADVPCAATVRAASGIGLAGAGGDALAAGASAGGDAASAGSTCAGGASAGAAGVAAGSGEADGEVGASREQPDASSRAPSSEEMSAILVLMEDPSMQTGRDGVCNRCYAGRAPAPVRLSAARRRAS
jgi:hypothetical protein